MKAAALAFALALFAAPAIAAPTDADLAAQRSVVLSMDLVNRWADSVRAMKAAEARDSALKEEVGQIEGGEQEQAPSAAIANLKAHPRVYAFFKANRLTESDAVLVGVALIDAAFAAGEKDLSAFPGVTPAQVAFVKAHDGELHNALRGVLGPEAQ
ncbi:MAG TPA: hypothetical protein VFE03_16975 [Caulobacteraceae bacterium]|jgi:hypothetical protein|nr:hypothetical protein [Caulobacteraceae bacterium]